MEFRAGLEQDLSGFMRTDPANLGGGPVKLDYGYAAGHLLDVVPNPWIGYEFIEKVFAKLLAKSEGKEKVVANNLVFTF